MSRYLHSDERLGLKRGSMSFHCDKTLSVLMTKLSWACQLGKRLGTRESEEWVENGRGLEALASLLNSSSRVTDLHALYVVE